SQSGKVNESRRQKIRAGDLQRRRSRLHAFGRAEQSECSRRRQKSTRRRLGALEDPARAIVKLAGTARCAVRTPQRGVPTAMKLPTRQRLPHDVPLWVDPSNADYFITICWNNAERINSHIAPSRRPFSKRSNIVGTARCAVRRRRG